MVNIDYIMDLLDWNQSHDEQQRGLELARSVKCISVFLQPGIPYGKKVWDNCAKILSDKNDDEISPYLIELMGWLQDMNWPGAFCILDRLRKFADTPSYQRAYHISLKYARALADDTWENNLRRLYEPADAKDL